MPTSPFARFASALVVTAALLAACSESDAGLDEVATTTTEPSTPDESASSDDPTAADRQGAIDLFVSQGISERGATCIVDAVIDEGIPVEELYQLEGLVVAPEIQEAFALASATCLDASDVAALPDAAFDLSNPIVRKQFVDAFSTTSGLSLDVSECVVDELIAGGFDARDAFGGDAGELDEDVVEAVTAAVETCA